jgi:hypothetical protein
MNKFKDFDITPVNKGYIGEKISINRIINKEIKIIGFKFKDSNYKEVDKYDKCLHLQIFVDDKMHVVFIGSETLVNMIQQLPEDGFPFFTTIIKCDDRRYLFT